MNYSKEQIERNTEYKHKGKLMRPIYELYLDEYVFLDEARIFRVRPHHRPDNAKIIVKTETENQYLKRLKKGNVYETEGLTNPGELTIIEKSKATKLAIQIKRNLNQSMLK